MTTDPRQQGYAQKRRDYLLAAINAKLLLSAKPYGVPLMAKAPRPQNSLAKFENSKPDKRVDKAGMKKSGMSAKAWEKSPMNAKADKAAMRKMGRGR